MQIDIISPKNGVVLDSGLLDINIAVHGYEAMSNMHGSSVCLGISNNLDVWEDCFPPTERVFHVNGLSPGKQYMLKVALFERNQAIAVSVRSVRVAGVRAAP